MWSVFEITIDWLQPLLEFWSKISVFHDKSLEQQDRLDTILRPWLKQKCTGSRFDKSASCQYTFTNFLQPAHTLILSQCANWKPPKESRGLCAKQHSIAHASWHGDSLLAFFFGICDFEGRKIYSTRSMIVLQECKNTYTLQYKYNTSICLWATRVDKE